MANSGATTGNRAVNIPLEQRMEIFDRLPAPLRHYLNHEALYEWTPESVARMLSGGHDRYSNRDFQGGMPIDAVLAQLRSWDMLTAQRDAVDVWGFSGPATRFSSPNYDEDEIDWTSDDDPAPRSSLRAAIREHGWGSI